MQTVKKSLPLQECGLKSFVWRKLIQNTIVTPLAGVWIEIMDQFRKDVKAV